jgi:hypothetical protein
LEILISCLICKLLTCRPRGGLNDINDLAKSQICISKFILGGIGEYQKLASEEIWKTLFSEILLNPRSRPVLSPFVNASPRGLLPPARGGARSGRSSRRDPKPHQHATEILECPENVFEKGNYPAASETGRTRDWSNEVHCACRTRIRRGLRQC